MQTQDVVTQSEIEGFMVGDGWISTIANISTLDSYAT